MERGFVEHLKLFSRECKWSSYFLTMCIYIVFILLCKKISKTTAILSENSWNKCRSDRFQWCNVWSLHTFCYRFLPSLNMNGVPKNCILVSDHIYNKKLSRQCNLPAQIEIVQDNHKIKYFSFDYFNKYLKVFFNEMNEVIFFLMQIEFKVESYNWEMSYQQCIC